MPHAPGSSHRVIWALRRAFLAVEAAKEQRLRPTGIAGAHYAVLLHVARAPGITGAALARALGVTPQNVAGLVARLEERGLLERRRHELHAHVLELHLTAEGVGRLAEADAAVSDLDRAAVDALGVAAAADLRALLEVVATADDLAGAGDGASSRRTSDAGRRPSPASGDTG